MEFVNLLVLLGSVFLQCWVIGAINQ